jgi:hypothetical protein
MTENDILDEVRSIVDKDRRKEYRDINKSFVHIASLWSDYLNHNITIFDVASMMALLKISHLKSNPLHMGSIKDIIGYMYCYEKLTHDPKKETKGRD